MFKRLLIGDYSRFTVSYIVKIYIISESLLWSSWSFISPIFALFIIKDISGTTIETVAFIQSIYLVIRVIAGLVSGRILLRSNERTKVRITLIGFSLVGLGFAGFAITHSLPMLMIFNSLTAIGMGLATPAKNVLFASHLDKNKEATEWGMTDGIVFIFMAMATALGGLLAAKYGFSSLFLLASATTFLGMIPYIVCIRKGKLFLT